ncbi:hypothetical protein TIFTF001_021380 [Ficus carica]|uniref:Uncharacterized protein n=1 Tax=Ficus carica TaxID=3494 RepID=A0AA88AYS7_FICCA|nr:hypothetical protein TIFTF001_021380 [Ficus carica]
MNIARPIRLEEATIGVKAGSPTSRAGGRESDAKQSRRLRARPDLIADDLLAQSDFHRFAVRTIGVGLQLPEVANLMPRSRELTTPILWPTISLSRSDFHGTSSPSPKTAAPGARRLLRQRRV